jgi:hypothetical protein
VVLPAAADRRSVGPQVCAVRVGHIPTAAAVPRQGPLSITAGSFPWPTVDRRCLIQFNTLDGSWMLLCSTVPTRAMYERIRGWHEQMIDTARNNLPRVLVRRDGESCEERGDGVVT